MDLYLIKTKVLGCFYVVESDTDLACNRLSQLLANASYGFSDDRQIEAIEILAHELGYFAEKPNFSPRHSKIIFPPHREN